MKRGTTLPISIAPMMAWTDRHYRFFMRQLSKHTLLYTEMVTTGALLHGDKHRHLDYSPEEQPIALQLGGDDPAALAACAQLAEDWGYTEVNLNVGCPSDRVQNGHFGACLMAKPDVVAKSVDAMRNATPLPITVKHRIGIDDIDSYEHMHHFVTTVASAGADRFSVHARKAWLKGLSPKENRTIPPLRYDDVYKLKQDLPELEIEINGGVSTLEDAQRHLNHVDAVMIGRAAYENPYLFAQVDRVFFQAKTPAPSRRQVIENMLPYIEYWTDQGVYLNHISRHMLGLFAGRPGAKAWKRSISENAHKPGAGVHTIINAMQQVPAEVLDESPAVSLTPVA